MGRHSGSWTERQRHTNIKKCVVAVITHHGNVSAEDLTEKIGEIWAYGGGNPTREEVIFAYRKLFPEGR